MSLLRRSGEPVSRLRTRRGDWPHGSEWLSIPIAITRRIIGRMPPSPWMAPGAVKYLDQALLTSDMVVELGGGASTAWLAARVASVTTIEPDPNWAQTIETLTATFNNVTVICEQVRQALPMLPPASVVIVDHDVRGDDISRADAVAWALSQDPPPRLVVFDDSDRAEFDHLSSGPTASTSYRGFRPNPLYLTETTILRPAGDPSLD